MNQFTSENFDQNARVALKDATLRGALKNLSKTIGGRRKTAIATVENWEELREKARKIKEETLLHLDKYLERFAENAEKAGAKIHWARDGKEATRIILDLINERGAKTVVKAKSMATEEIHLNHALEAEGIEAVETDLGEYIIQIADETPSHIVVPAIHKTKQQIADLFVEKIGIEPTEDVGVLTQTARKILRSKFAEAQIGISGANFAVAETGTILILENEGNIRLTTSLTKTHIALVGIEKIIPKFADLDVFLKLLPRSGTGQKLTTYQSLITGTKREKNAEGPEEIHIVLMDNGRSKMLAHPVTRQSLACIRCGACLNACPVYGAVGGHAYGAVYPGPIGAVITPQLLGIEKTKQLPYASSLCGACREVCPVKIDIPELLLHLRAEITDGEANGKKTEKPIKVKFAERFAFSLYAKAWERAGTYKLGTKTARFFQKFLSENGKIGEVSGVMKMLAPPLANWTEFRDAPTVAPKSFREIWKEELKKD
ncbi:MAG TPA: LutB/LldF family L-lactate oxidation iron-sulfur protein [Pyrinomonadaceae bacterium]|nr:LutB/LldF family L-lactate oxidation iron-sulfur protein [Pyrinomonadaceae bacterium]